ncbi:BRO family, N-terminal domain [Seinonella peptonophila]|uniref:BRO family, N-terminal domain n=1 Tax=Seinonella peptonophila TaxID=112248 RepID=A0A1M5A5J6_9BACL|nr:BRO family protein [Seinonella peptonophila]SHF25465.1 BRO family, N-terminal domain [Seinonella peptonophila]
MENNIIQLHNGSKVKVVNEVDFEFKGLKLPAMVDENNEFWFVLSDVADIMEIKKNSRGQMTRSLDIDEKAEMTICHTSSIQIRPIVLPLLQAVR